MREVRCPSGAVVRRIQADSLRTAPSPDAVIVLSGELLTETGGTRLVAGAGDLLFLDSHTARRCVAVTEVEAAVCALPRPFFSGFPAAPLLLSRATMGNLVHLLLLELESLDHASARTIDALLLQLVAWASRLATNPGPPWPAWLHDAVRYTYATTDHAVTAREVATATGVSHRTIRSAFQARLGRRVADVSLETRIEAALRRLRDGSTIAAVTESLGFYDQSHFARAFRRTTGMPPTAMRQPR